MRYVKFITLPRKDLCLLLFAFMLSSSLMAQFKVSGTVVTEEGEPLIGATISVKGSNSFGTVTDIDGGFSMDLPDGEQTLVLSYTGYLELEVPVNNQSELSVTMSENATQLDEVVVIGYGQVSKRDLTGSVSSVKGEDLTKIQSISFEQGLAARAPGVQIVSSEGGPGSSAKIRIRGGTSINASNDPLYVIDGFPILGSSQNSGVGLGNSSSSPLSSIDPSDIESIEILKDASATAIYGSRGANGVVLITTKSGKKGRTQTNFETYFGMSEIARNLDLLTPQEFVDFWNEYFVWDPNDPTNRYTTQYRDGLGNNIQLDDDQLTVLDWRNRVFKQGQVQNYRFSMNGGNDRTNYSSSFGYIDQSGIVNNSNFSRLSGNLKVNQKINDKLRGGFNMNIGYTKNVGVITAASQSSNGQNGLITNVTLFTPVQGRVNVDDAEYDEDGILISTRDGDIVNPERLANDVTNTNNNINAFGNAFLEYSPLKGLAIRSSLGSNVNYFRARFFYPGTFGWGRNTNGRARIGSNQNLNWLNENTVSYNNTFGVSKINAVLGFTQQRSRFESLVSEAIDFAIPGVNLDNLAAANEVLPTRSNGTEWSLLSYIGRFNYTLNERYLFTVTARYDGSSRFAEGNKWGLFPSAAFAWRLGEEGFIQNIDAISSAKARASYGISGNHEIGLYRSLASYNLANYVADGARDPGLSINRLSNPDLTWETTAQLDVGFEFGLFKDRIYFNFDYYKKNTTDLLLEVPIPYTSGFNFAFKNIGEVENRGVELSLSTVNMKKGGFQWRTDFNISFNRNQVISLGPEAEEFTVSSIGAHRNDYIVRVGESLGSIYGFTWDGIYNYDDFVEFDGLDQVQREAIMADFDRGQDEWFTLKDGVPTKAGTSKYRPGMIRFSDLNGDGVIDVEDRSIIGNTQPDHFGGITNNFSYKGVDLSVFMTWSYGNDVYNNNVRRGTATAIPFFNKYGVIRDRWTPENPDTDMWSIWGGADGGSGDDTHSFFVEDGSYLRLSNVTLGYTFSKAKLKKARINSLRVYAAADNLHVWTKYTGFDPDVSVGRNQLTPGLDWDAYPRMRTVRAGLNIGF
ncbi:MAG: TonB-dependent receptor [Bacteroidota bacterium]